VATYWWLGMLQSGIKASSSNTRLVWAKTSANWENSLLYILIYAKFGKTKKLERNPQFCEKDHELNDSRLSKKLMELINTELQSCIQFGRSKKLSFNGRCSAGKS
jgi:hypothetical protein